MRVNISIRKENEDKWKQIPNKSGWVNDMLSAPKLKAPPEDLEIRPGVTWTIEERSPLAQIGFLEMELDERLEYCQDPIERKKIEIEYKQKIQEQWDLYHAEKKVND